jgi:hypothetical protein
MKRLLVLVNLLFMAILPEIYSQQPVYVLGKVLDSKTSQPVSFAALHLKDAQFGVYSNAEGDFRFLNVPGFQTDSLILTCIGYKKLSVAFSSLKASEMNILKLVPNIHGLKEVTVIARKKRLNTESILAKAIRNIKKNCPVVPFSYVSYFRDYQKDSSNYLNLHEAIIQTLDKGFKNTPDSNRYRLIDFKKNMNFSTKNISPYYDLPETDHSDESFKKIPHAIVGDQNGNEFFVLLVHNPIRNFNQKSFDYVDILTQNFINNHWFSNPVGIYDGGTLLFKIDFTAKRRLTEDIYKGSIFIQPDDYSIHKLEYRGSYLDSDKNEKEIFKIEIEYGYEPAVGSKMCLKYISFSNTFIFPDSSDNDFFKVLHTDWWTLKSSDIETPTTLIAKFNHDIDPVSAKKSENYVVTVGNRHAQITGIRVKGHDLYITVRNKNFSYKELQSTYITYDKNFKDIYGNPINKRRDLEFRQFRELFVQEYNKPIEFKNNCFIEYKPLEENCKSLSDISGRFWMNTPLKASEGGVRSEE